MINQTGDVAMLATSNGGDICVSDDGYIAMNGGLFNAAYLALFGGNPEDSGLDGDRKQWWGNSGEPEVRTYRSQTQNLLFTLPSTMSNLGRLEDAAKGDLEFLVTSEVATSVEVSVSLVSRNRVALDICITADGVDYQFEFEQNWRLQ